MIQVEIVDDQKDGKYGEVVSLMVVVVVVAVVVVVVMVVHYDDGEGNEYSYY